MPALSHKTRGPYIAPALAPKYTADLLDEKIVTMPGLSVWADTKPGLLQQRTDGIAGWQAWNAANRTRPKSPDASTTPVSPVQAKDGALDCWQWPSTTQQNGLIFNKAILNPTTWSVFWGAKFDAGAANETQCFLSGPNGTVVTVGSEQRVIRLQVSSAGVLSMINFNGGGAATILSDAHDWADTMVFGMLTSGPEGIRLWHNRFLCAPVPGAAWPGNGVPWTLDITGLCFGALAGFGASAFGLSHGSKTHCFGVLDGEDLSTAANAAFRAALFDAAQARLGFITTGA